MYYTSANRDEDVFDDPQRFDIHRAPEPAPVVRDRRALLPRRAPGPARGQGVLRGAAGHVPHHRAHRRARPHPLEPQQRARSACRSASAPEKAANCEIGALPGVWRRNLVRISWIWHEDPHRSSSAHGCAGQIAPCSDDQSWSICSVTSATVAIRVARWPMKRRFDHLRRGHCGGQCACSAARNAADPPDLDIEVERDDQVATVSVDRRARPRLGPAAALLSHRPHRSRRGAPRRRPRWRHLLRLDRPRGVRRGAPPGHGVERPDRVPPAAAQPAEPPGRERTRPESSPSAEGLNPSGALRAPARVSDPLPGGVAEWLRQGPAKPCTPVRFRSPPPTESQV